MTTSASGRSGIPELVRFRLLGVGFIITVALALIATVGLFNKAFTPVVHVTVKTARAGLQLLPRSDVKVRGLIVGEVRATHATADGATLDLALDPDKAKLIPSNVTARLLPKTLFGEKYVDLIVPAQPAVSIHSGAVIHQDTSAATVEVDQVLGHLLPLLQAVKPEKLNATLNALATALQGRGDQLGRNLELADSLLKKINPQLPTVVYDLKALSQVSDIYNEAAPDLLQTLRNLNTTSQTIVDKKVAIENLIPAVTNTGDKLNRFMNNNGNKIIGFNIANREALGVIARYSPELPCVMKGVMKLLPRAEDAGGGNGPTYNLTIEIVKPRPAYKNPLDLPEAKDYRGPRCYNLPNPKVPFPDYMALDGTQDDLWWKNPDPIDQAGTSTKTTKSKTPAKTTRKSVKTAGTSTSTTTTGRGRALSGVFVMPGSEADEQETVKNAVAPMLRIPADQLPDVTALLFGPLVDGSVVNIG